MAQHPQGENELLKLLAQQDVTKVADPTQPTPEMGGAENLLLNLLSGIMPQFAQSAAGLQPQRPNLLLALATGMLLGAPKGIGKALAPKVPGIFGGVSELGKRGLRVFARAEGSKARTIVSITPNPKKPGTWKATIFDDTREQGQVLRSVVDFDTRKEALEAVGGGRKFFEGFKEIPIGKEAEMEATFARLFTPKKAS